MALLVVSPHLDDAVFGCAGWLLTHRGSTVATVFASEPPDAGRQTEWDARCGFATAGEAMRVRRQEDAAALAVLGARPLWLPFVDDQYGHAAPPSDLVEALDRALQQVACSGLLFPLGLFHADHVRTHEAALEVWRRQPALQALAYEDALYRNAEGLLQRRLCELLAAGIAATPLRQPPLLDAERAAKAAAVAAYASQRRAFGAGGLDDTLRPERLWRLRRLEDAA